MKERKISMKRKTKRVRINGIDFMCEYCHQVIDNCFNYFKFCPSCGRVFTKKIYEKGGDNSGKA